MLRLVPSPWQVLPYGASPRVTFNERQTVAVASLRLEAAAEGPCGAAIVKSRGVFEDGSGPPSLGLVGRHYLRLRGEAVAVRRSGVAEHLLVGVCAVGPNGAPPRLQAPLRPHTLRPPAPTCTQPDITPAPAPAPSSTPATPRPSATLQGVTQSRWMCARAVGGSSATPEVASPLTVRGGVPNRLTAQSSNRLSRSDPLVEQSLRPRRVHAAQRSSRAPASLFRCAGLRALSPPVREATSGPFDLRLEIELHGTSAPNVKVSGNFTLRAALGEAEPLRLVEAAFFPWGNIQNSGLEGKNDPWHLWAALGRAHPAEVAVSWPRPPQWAATAGAALGRSPHLAGCQGPHKPRLRTLSHSAAPRSRPRPHLAFISR